MPVVRTCLTVQVSPAQVERPPLLPASVCGAMSRRGTSAAALDVRRNKVDPPDDLTLGAFVKIIFKIPKGSGTNMVATLSR